MSDPSELLNFYLIFRQSERFAQLNEEVLLSFLQLGRCVRYPGNSVILKEGSDIRFIYAFVEGIPANIDTSGKRLVFWGLEALIAPYSSPSDLLAPPAGTLALVFSVPRLIAFLNEAPDLLISLLRQTAQA